jgi:hypothetical protein
VFKGGRSEMLNRGNVCLGKYDDLNVHEAILDPLLSFLARRRRLLQAAEALGCFLAKKIDAHRKAQERRS